MTFYDISKKLLRANFARYRLYFFCNLFAAALFFCFAAIFTNRSFMNGEIVNSSISNNIYLPSLLSALFLVLFLPVSCQVFLGARKQEYGVMLSLGMSRKEAFWNLLIENMAVALMALAAALLAGTILSALFFCIYHLWYWYQRSTVAVRSGTIQNYSFPVCLGYGRRVCFEWDETPAG